MYHLYAGSGTVKDSSGIQRALQATAMISDQLQTWVGGGPGQPVHLFPGQPLPNGQYQFRISDWHVAIDRIGIFSGQSGSIYLEFVPQPPNLGIGDKMWFFNSDAAPAYNWAGQITAIELPNNWTNPSAPDYGHLPSKIKCAGAHMGQSAGGLFSIPPNFVLTRI